MKNTALILIGVAAAAVSTAASADAPRYDFVEVFYQSITDPSGSGISSDHAIGLDGSYAFTDNWVGMAQYGHENADFSSVGISGTDSGDDYEAGIGYRIPLSDSVDLFPNLAYLSQSATASAPGFISNSVTNTGYDAGLELRAMVAPKVELDASFDHTSPGSASNQIAVAALYSFTSSVALGLAYASDKSNGQTTTGWSVSLRYYFK